VTVLIMHMFWCYLMMASSVWSVSLPAPSDLRVEYMSSPIGLSEIQPRFQFIVNCSKCPRGTSQRAVQIVVTTAFGTHSVVWDSGILVSNRTSQLEYGGSPLKSETSYLWTVRWWSVSQSSPSPTSTASFEIGLLSEDNWAGAEWIGRSDQTQLRHEFTVPAGSPIVRARAYIAAPGCHTLYVNGKEYASTVVGSDQMGVCPWTQFGKSVLYQTHNLTSLVQSGPNAIGLLLGNGMWSKHKNPYAKDPGVRVKLTVDLANGSRAIIISQTASSSPNLCTTVREHSTAILSCASGDNVHKLDFASFGTPTGTCTGDASKSDANTFAVNSSCSANNASNMVSAACMGKAKCKLSPLCIKGSCSFVTNGPETQDPCMGVLKHLSVAIQCIAGSVTPTTDIWMATKGPHLSNDPFFGTHTDWRLLDDPKTNAWSTPGFSINQSVVSWTRAVAMPLSPPGQLRALTMPLTRVIRIIHPTNVTKLPGKQGYRYDFPENFVGIVKVTVPGTAPAGSNVTLKHGEILTTNGTVSFPWDESEQTDVHTLDGRTQVLVPRFTWHGFQHVQIRVQGFAWDGRLNAIEGLVLHTNLDQTGDISFTGGPSGEGALLTSIQNLVTRGQLSNVAAYQPTDCPTREKHGWLGDAQVTAEEAIYNFNMAPIYTEFLNTIQDGQDPKSASTPGDVPAVCPIGGLKVQPSYSSNAAKYHDISWTAAYPLIARWMLKYYGDTRVVTRHFDSLMQFVDGVLANANKTNGLPNPWVYGDWCSMEDRTKSRPGTGPELSAFNYILSLDAMAEMALQINRSIAYTKYANLAEKFRPIFHSNYFNPSTGTYGWAPIEVQTLTVAPLALGNTIPKDKLDIVLKNLQADIENRTNHFTVGAVGSKHLLPQLSANGLHETAMRVATQTTFPSFGYWISLGATTCWENYRGIADGTHPPPPTHNHIFLCGGFGEWVYRSVAGIAPSANGYDHIIVAPQISSNVGPSAVRASLRTVRGLVSVDWKFKGDSLMLVVIIPSSVRADVEVPLLGASTETFKILESSTVVWTNGTFVPGVDGVVAGIQYGQVIRLQVLSGVFFFATEK